MMFAVGLAVTIDGEGDRRRWWSGWELVDEVVMQLGWLGPGGCHDCAANVL
jgi:hypothetical protein